MKQIQTIVTTWCDYPNCAEVASTEKGLKSQETTTVEFSFYAHARGRKTAPITVELCDMHRDEMKDIYTAMKKFDQKEAMS
jgi:hypothetical protein